MGKKVIGAGRQGKMGGTGKTQRGRRGEGEVCGKWEVGRNLAVECRHPVVANTLLPPVVLYTKL